MTGGARLELACGLVCSSWAGNGVMLIGGLFSLIELERDLLPDPDPDPVGDGFCPSCPSTWELERDRCVLEFECPGPVSCIAPILLNPADTGGCDTPVSLAVRRSGTLAPTSIPFPLNAFIRSAILPIEVVSGPDTFAAEDDEEGVGDGALVKSA
jgi:hypothetical protein